jgi:hypothetical protein
MTTARFIKIVLVAMFVFPGVQWVASAQGLLLTQGQNYVFEFTSLPYVRPAAQRDAGSFAAYFAPGTFSDGESVLVEVFADTLSDPPLSSTYTHSGPPEPLGSVALAFGWSSSAPPFFPDLQGVARVTMLSGDAELQGFAVKQVINGGVYSQYFPLPESIPRLTLSAPGNGQLQISWPTNFPGYTLESTTNLATPVWSGVTNGVTNPAGFFSVTIDTSLEQRFFRLHVAGGGPGQQGLKLQFSP